MDPALLFPVEAVHFRRILVQREDYVGVFFTRLCKIERDRGLPTARTIPPTVSRPPTVSSKSAGKSEPTASQQESQKEWLHSKHIESRR